METIATIRLAKKTLDPETGSHFSCGWVGTGREKEGTNYYKHYLVPVLGPIWVLLTWYLFPEKRGIRLWKVGRDEDYTGSLESWGVNGIAGYVRIRVTPLYLCGGWLTL